MNKVVSVEIARQMFWMEEIAYEALRDYLDTLRAQLAGNDCAGEIVDDIELRVAELLHAQASDGRRAIANAQLDEVIAQIGYIDDQDRDAGVARRSYRDPRNKMLGGVCAGLAKRLGIPALILRLLFVALAALFGLGVALYLILWIALDPSDNRGAVLASEGRAQTAARIATAEASVVDPLRQLQRILFLPVSLVGALIEALTAHLARRRRGYGIIGRNLLGLGMFVLAGFVVVNTYRFTGRRLFSLPVTWSLGGAVIYLLILALALFLRHVYLDRPTFKIRRDLLLVALIPIALLVIASLYINDAHSEHAGTSIERRFDLRGSRLALAFADATSSTDGADGAASPVAFAVRTGDKRGEVVLYVDYSADGPDLAHATANIHDIDYTFSFAGDTLHLDRFWTLHDKALRRGQGVRVVVVVPPDIVVDSSRPLKVDADTWPIRYGIDGDISANVSYLSRGDFLHEADPAFADALSANESAVLGQTFCESFFTSESWRCPTNLREPIRTNPRLATAWKVRGDELELLRLTISRREALSLEDLRTIEAQFERMRGSDSANLPFREYVRHLSSIKTPPPAIPSQNSE